MFKKVFQQGHSEREAEAYRGPVAGVPIAALAMGRIATGDRFAPSLNVPFTRCTWKSNGSPVRLGFSLTGYPPGGCCWKTFLNIL